MKDIKEILIGIVVAAAVIVTLAFYVLNAGNIDLNVILLVGVALILVVFALYMLWDRIKNIKKGLPAKDERSKLTSYKAGYYGFIAAIWSAVLGPLFFEIVFDYELPGSRVSAVVVIVSALVFFASYLYMYWKGK